jgi:hypothetical protein
MDALRQVSLSEDDGWQGDEIPVECYLVLGRANEIDMDAGNQRLQKHSESCWTTSKVVTFRYLEHLIQTNNLIDPTQMPNPTH